jgi:hypothetical protein
MATPNAELYDGVFTLTIVKVEMCEFNVVLNPGHGFCLLPRWLHSISFVEDEMRLIEKGNIRLFPYDGVFLRPMRFIVNIAMLATIVHDCGNKECDHDTAVRFLVFKNAGGVFSFPDKLLYKSDFNEKRDGMRTAAFRSIEMIKELQNCFFGEHGPVALVEDKTVMTIETDFHWAHILWQAIVRTPVLFTSETLEVSFQRYSFMTLEEMQAQCKRFCSRDMRVLTLLQADEAGKISWGK